MGRPRGSPGAGISNVFPGLRLLASELLGLGMAVAATGRCGGAV